MAKLGFDNRFLPSLIGLLFFASITTSAQKTVEQVERTAENVGKTVETIKNIGGLFKKKKKETDVQVKETEKSRLTKKEEINLLSSPILTKAVVAKLIFDKEESVEFLWQPQPSEKIDEMLLDQLLSDDKMLHTEIGEIFTLTDQPIANTVLLLTYAYGRDNEGNLQKASSRATSVGIGFASFIKNDSGNWQLTAVQKLVDRLGANGELPEHKMVNFAPNLSTLAFTDSYGMGGQSETHQHFYALNSQYLGKKVFEIQTEESYDGGGSAKKAYAITNTYQVLPLAAGEEYPRIAVTKKSGKMVKSTTRYGFSKEKGEYVATKAGVPSAKPAVKKATVAPAKKQ